MLSVVGEHPIRILWIGKRPVNADSGDAVFDQRTIAALRRRGHLVDVLHPSQVSRRREVLNLASGVPHYRARFASSENRAAVARRAGLYDQVICSGEWLDCLANTLSPASTLIVHNVTSRALPSLFPGNVFAKLGAARALAYERRWYRPGRFRAIAALSQRDYQFLSCLAPGLPVVLTPPGMPRMVQLNDTAEACPELVLSGTYGWAPRRRDVLRFADEYMTLEHRYPVRTSSDLPAKAKVVTSSSKPSTDESRSGIRFGLITDRFEAGHKLKTLSHIATNEIVLSFADVDFDFSGIDDFAFFIRRLRSVDDISRHVNEVMSIAPQTLRARLTAFKAACAKRFDWDAVAGTLLEAAGATACTHLLDPVE